MLKKIEILVNKFLALLLAAVCGVLVIMAAAKYIPQNETEKINVTVRLQSGETIWCVVNKAMECAGDTRQIEEVIYYTTRKNNLKPRDIGVLPVGTTLVIPCERRL